MGGLEHRTVRCRRTVYAVVFLGALAGALAVAGEPQGSAGGQVLVAPPGDAATQDAGSQPANPIDYSTARFDRIVRAGRITDRITIDGRLNEPAWVGRHCEMTLTWAGTVSK